MVKKNQAFVMAISAPDLNMWADLKRRVHKRGPGTLEDLERFCLERGMVSDSVLLTKGGCTKY